MKALTLTQPWATLVVIGAKRVETRSWATKYRGPLAIHAAKGVPVSARELCFVEPFRGVLRKAGYFDWESLPRGFVVATVCLDDCLSTSVAQGGELERCFGDWGLGRFCWMLSGVERLEVPIPARGSLGLWEWTR